MSVLAGRTRLLAPARVILDRAEATNRSLGHENLGFLSAAHGFMPSVPPRERMPAGFEAWDAAAVALPELHASLRLRGVLDGLPVLDAGPAKLPDVALLRAGHLLAMLAHAYYYVETQPPAAMPEAIVKPWAEVRQRLGRHGAVLSYIDLIVYNFRLVDSGAPDPFRVENMRLLTPTVDTREEHVFYLTQAEILACASPIVAAVVRAQEAVVADDPAALAVELGVVRERLEAMQRSLRKIEPRAASPTHVNPVVWAKTVAPFAVPMVPGVQGPSGTSSPIFNLLDAFLGRARHETFLGREIRELRQGYPPFWREILEAVGEVSVSAYVAARKERQTTELLAAVLDAYAGNDGFLGRHRRKVYGYLETAFKVGRSVTIGGFSGQFHDRTWNQVDAELEASRRERPAAGDAPVEGLAGAETAGPPSRPLPAGPDPPGHDASELIVKNGEAGECWIAFDGHVYDVTAFLHLHPGGAHVLRLYAGMDGTRAFARAHRGARIPAAMRERYRLGPLRVPALEAAEPEQETAQEGQLASPSRVTEVASIAGLYRRWLQFAYLVVEMQNALRLDIGLQSAVTEPQAASVEADRHRTRYKLQRAVETQERFVGSYLATCTGALVEELWRDTEGLCLGQPTGFFHHAMAAAVSDGHREALTQATSRLRAAVAPEGRGDLVSPRLIEICQSLERLAQDTISEVKAVFHEGLQAFERYESLLLARRRALLPSLLARLPTIVGAYYDGAAVAMEGPGP